MAGQLTTAVWGIVAFAEFLAMILTAVVVAPHLTHGSWQSHLVANFLPGLASVAVSVMVVVNVRIRAAERSVARGDSAPSSLATPKLRDLLPVLVLAAGLIALGNGATGGIG
jgi:hypothetical protein